MSKTKKLLVAFDPERPENQSSDFLIPFQTEGQTILYGLKSRTKQSHGLIIYLGRAITEHDLFAKLVDGGAEVESVDATLACFRQYIENLQSLRVGNVVRLQASQGEGFELERIANTPSGFPR
jgi:hypothetical protein